MLSYIAKLKRKLKMTINAYFDASVQEGDQTIEREKAENDGIKKGEVRKEIELVLSMYDVDMTVNQIAKITKKSEAQIRKIIDTHRG